jgi:hypothetical protein
MTGSFNSILSFYQLKNGIFHIVQQLNLGTHYTTRKYNP